MYKPRTIAWILVPTLVVAVLLYLKGLHGPFLFDDHVHIARNQWVKILSLDWNSLVQAWNSSFSPFPGDRPLAQLTFGINHAISGLNPWAFKFTNLLIHLLNGVLLFVFVRLVYRAATGKAADGKTEQMLAVATVALWLLHPMHVSTVLYPVQRMAMLATLGMLAALCAYFHGRLKIARGEPGVAWIISAVPMAIIGFLAKENTVLLPLLLLVSELTVLASVTKGDRATFIRLTWVLFIVVPLALGSLYLISKQATLLNYAGRSFSLEERVMTQPRVLWLYLQWLMVPELSAFGLFHDDIPVSKGLLNPPTTIAAIIALCVLLVLALVGRRRMPIPAFAVFFYFANHALESTVLPLEMVFEHRNYLASVGPLLLLAYLVVIASARMRVRPLAFVLGSLLLLSYATVTHLRANNWSSYTGFILKTAENHPNSSRSNFLAAQLMITMLTKSESPSPELEEAARYFLQNGLDADPQCIDCLFGLVVLELGQARQPEPSLIRRLKDSLRTGFVGPTKITVTQFSYLVKWYKSGATRLAAGDLEAVFDAALANPNWNHTGRAGIEAAYREYYEFVAGDLEAALEHAQAALKAWPQPWNYHMQLVRVLEKLGRHEEALTALDGAAVRAGNEKQQRETAEARIRIGRKLAK